MVLDMARIRGVGAHIPIWQPWTALALFAFLLNFIWEIVQSPFYGMAGAPHEMAIRTCTLATLGDVVFTLAAYAAVAGVTRHRLWGVRWRPRYAIAFVAVGLLLTVVAEYVNVFVLLRYQYAPEMPRLAGIGVSPLLQWLIIPIIALWLTRRHLEVVAAVDQRY